MPLCETNNYLKKFGMEITKNSVTKKVQWLNFSHYLQKKYILIKNRKYT